MNGGSGFGEVIFVHRAQDIGLARPDAHLVLDHQTGEAVAIDQNDAVLDFVEVVAGLFREVGGGDKDTPTDKLPSQNILGIVGGADDRS